MYKKLLTACMALSAFVALAVVPTVASASPELTHPTGVTAGLSPITADLVGHSTMTSPLGSITCTSATMTGKLVTNSGTQVEGNIESAHFTGKEAEGDCEGPLGRVKVTANVSTPWCVKTTKTADQFELRGGNCSEASRKVTFILHMGGLVCKYEKASVTGTYTTHPTDAILHASTPVFTRFESSAFCPASGELHMSFTLTTENTAMYFS